MGTFFPFLHFVVKSGLLNPIQVRNAGFIAARFVKNRRKTV
jgi:hypothetical protein